MIGVLFMRVNDNPKVLVRPLAALRTARRHEIPFDVLIMTAHARDRRADRARRGVAPDPSFDLPRRHATGSVRVARWPHAVAGNESHPAVTTRRRLALRSSHVGGR